MLLTFYLLVKNIDFNKNNLILKGYFSCSFSCYFFNLINTFSKVWTNNVLKLSPQAFTCPAPELLLQSPACSLALWTDLCSLDPALLLLFFLYFFILQPAESLFPFGYVLKFGSAQSVECVFSALTSLCQSLRNRMCLFLHLEIHPVDFHLDKRHTPASCWMFGGEE